MVRNQKLEMASNEHTSPQSSAAEHYRAYLISERARLKHATVASRLTGAGAVPSSQFCRSTIPSQSGDCKFPKLSPRNDHVSHGGKVRGCEMPIQLRIIVEVEPAACSL